MVLEKDIKEFWEGKDVSETEFGSPKINKETIIKYSSKFRDNIKFAFGKFYTSEEYEEKRRRIYSIPLP